MPRKLRTDVSGIDLLKFFELHNFILKRTKGSHMVLARNSFSKKQTLVVPSHKIIPKGTLDAIYKQATQYISEAELFNEFYSE